MGGVEHGPLRGCCAFTSSRLTLIENLSTAYPWVDTLGVGPSPWLSNQPGFELSAWNDLLVISSWLRVGGHVREGHGDRAWADFLHALTEPCFVVEEQQRRRQRGRKRLAFYRLGPGAATTFRLAVVEQYGDRTALMITAFPRPSVGVKHDAVADVLDACPAFCLRQRDLDPHTKTKPPPSRWSAATLEPGSDTCCERVVDCSRSAAAPPTTTVG